MTANEAELMTRYIPPPGAMQFHATRGSNDATIDLFFWVSGDRVPIKFERCVKECKCTHAFVVIRLVNKDSPTLPLTNWEQGQQPGYRIIVCTCIGRIIE